MAKKPSGLLIVIIIVLAAFLSVAQSIRASSPLSVGLTRFEAIALDNAVRLEWDTETELGTAGFMLKRGQNGSFEYLSEVGGTGKLFIGSEGGPIQGYDYAHTDETAVNGESYTYQLIEVTTGGSEAIQADTSVTAGIVPTNTPIILRTAGGDGNDNNPATAAVTATPTTSAFASPTPPSNVAQVQPATPFPTAPPTATASTLAAQNSTAPATAVVNEIAANDNIKAAPISDQPTSEENALTDQTEVSGIAVALAQDDPASYPGPETVEGDFGESVDDAGADTRYDQQVAPDSIENPIRPEVIGNDQYPADSLLPDPATEGQNAETIVPENSFAGKVYLWVAFLATIVIFTAAVLGAILLYTRQRNKE